MEFFNNFKHYQTDNNIELFICSNPKFKTNLITIYLIQALEAKTVSKTAIVPYILYRGSLKYPGIRDFKIKLDELYGAELSVSVIKRGEFQILSFSLEIINDRFIRENVDLLQNGIELLFELITNPLFSETFVEQEKEHLIREIKALINDKYSYALERCFQEMCSEEPFGLNKLGKIEEIKSLQKDSIFKHYQKIFRENKLFAFIIGDIKAEVAYKEFNNKAKFIHNRDKKLTSPVITKNIMNVHQVVEKKNVEQGKLVMGFRTGEIKRNSNLFYELLFFNAVLGAFPHSRLFRKLREEASLAYYVNSWIESTKGLMVINAGIDSINYERSINIINEQLELLKLGDINDEEFSWTKKSLINNYKSIADSARGLTAHYLLGLINKKKETIDTTIAKIKNLRKEDINNIAPYIKLDTIYFLDKKVE